MKPYCGTQVHLVGFLLSAIDFVSNDPIFYDGCYPIKMALLMLQSITRRKKDKSITDLFGKRCYQEGSVFAPAIFPNFYKTKAELGYNVQHERIKWIIKTKNFDNGSRISQVWALLSFQSLFDFDIIPISVFTQ